MTAMKTAFTLLLLLLLLTIARILGCNCPKNNASSSAGKGGWEALANLANYDTQLIKDYCRADFCLEASVKSDKSFIEDDNGSTTHAFYNFKSVRYFRYKPSSLDAIESGLFLTPLDDCGVDLKTKGIYYLCGTALGPNAWVTACDYGKKFEALSFSERIFFLAGYKKVNCFDQNIDPQPPNYIRQPPPNKPPRQPSAPYQQPPPSAPNRPSYPPPPKPNPPPTYPNSNANTQPQRAPPPPPLPQRPNPPPTQQRPRPPPVESAPPMRAPSYPPPNQQIYGQQSAQRPKETPTQRPEMPIQSVQSALQMFPMLTNFSQLNHKEPPHQKPVEPLLPQTTYDTRPEMAAVVPERPVFGDQILPEIPDIPVDALFGDKPHKDRQKNDNKNEHQMHRPPPPPPPPHHSASELIDPVFPSLLPQIPNELPDMELEPDIRPVKDQNGGKEYARPPVRAPADANYGQQRPAKYPNADYDNNYVPNRRPTNARPERPEDTSPARRPRPPPPPANEQYWNDGHQREPQSPYERPQTRGTRRPTTTTTTSRATSAADYDYDDEPTTTQRANLPAPQKPNSPRMFDKQSAPKTGSKEEFVANYEQFADRKPGNAYISGPYMRPQKYERWPNATADEDYADADLIPPRRSALNVNSGRRPDD